MSTEEQTKDEPVAETKETNEPAPSKEGSIKEEESGSSSSDSSSYSGDSESADGPGRPEPMSKRDALKQCRRMGNTMPMVQYHRYRQKKAQEMLKKLTKKEEEKE